MGIGGDGGDVHTWARASRVHHTILMRFFRSNLMSSNLSKSRSITRAFSQSCSAWFRAREVKKLGGF